MTNRRRFLGGLLAAGAWPRTTWADAGAPRFLSAARARDGRYVLCGITRSGDRAFTHPLPDRGHAAAAHPHKPLAVAFARRPGTFALVIDCISGAQIATLDAPAGRHFYGHGTFSRDGNLLFTTENDYESGHGIVGVWDTTRGYMRVGEFASGGVGPHDIKLMPDGETLVVANGGIETHPETGRTKLNLSTMRSNLSYVSLDGVLQAQLHLPEAHQRNSIRHLAVGNDGTVSFAMQWQGDLSVDLPLFGRHAWKEDHLALASDASIRRLDGYLGSIAVSADGQSTAITSPRKGLMQTYTGTEHSSEQVLADVCGIASDAEGFWVTTGAGQLISPTGQRTQHPLAWDNHLIAL